MVRFVLPLGLLACCGMLAAQPEEKPVRLGGTRLLQPTTATVTSTPAISDEEALRAADLSPTDGAKLVGYLKQRTVSDSEQGKIQQLIKKFAADRFEDRLAAASEVEQFGPAAIGPLKAAEKDGDPEIAYRAALVAKRLEKVPHAAVAAAAVRAVVKLKPPGAAAALLGFLPLADSEALVEDIRGALTAVAVLDGKADPALVAALADPTPLRRSAAYAALIEGGPPGDRIRIPDAFPQVKDAVRKETDIEAKFQGLWALALTTREKEFLPDLIGMIPQLPRGRLWQVEELLLQLAGTHPEGGRFGKTEDSLNKTRDAWAAWWGQKGGAIDFTKLVFKPRVQGFTDLVMVDQSGLGRNGSVVTLGPDLKEKSRMSAANFHPHDARTLADGKSLVVEQNYARVSERDMAGTIIKSQSINQPVAAEATPDGGRLYVCRSVIQQFDKDGTLVWTYTRPNNSFDVLTGRRLPNGETLFVTNTTQAGPNCFRLDDKGKAAGEPLTLGRMQGLFMAGLDVIGPDKILIGESDRVVEYDLKTGKAGWSYTVGMPTSVQRLVNGNTLIGVVNTNRAIEVDPAGEVVWEFTPKDGLKLARAYRR